MRSRTNLSIAPSRPPGWNLPKSTRGEAAALQQRDRERVAERHLHQRRGGRREIVRAGFARLRQREHDVGRLPERAVGGGGDGDQPDAEPARIVDQVLELGGLARPGQRHDHVVVGDHAEVAVARFARMDEEGGRAGRGQRRGDLAADMAGLAHAGDDHPAARAPDQIDRRDEGGARGRRATASTQRGDARRLPLRVCAPPKRQVAAVRAGRPLGAQRLRLGHGLQRRAWCRLGQLR